MRPLTSDPPPWATSTFFVIVLTTLSSAIGAKLSLTWLLNALHELLLPRDAVEVGVRVAVADVVERPTPGQLLVAGLEG